MYPRTAPWRITLSRGLLEGDNTGRKLAGVRRLLGILAYATLLRCRPLLPVGETSISLKTPSPRVGAELMSEISPQ